MTKLGRVREGTDIGAVIFDMDGVLTDSEPLINAAAIAMFKEKGLVAQPEDFLPFVGTGEDRYIGGVAEKYQFPLDLPSAKARTYEIYLELVPTKLEAFPGARDLVQSCRQAGLRVAVASSADRVKIEANLRQIRMPPDSWDAVVFGEEVLNKKPAPDIFLSAAAKLGLTPGQCVVVEDAVNGIEAAKAAGMRCVAVGQTFSTDRLQHADLVRRNILEVSIADLLGKPDVRGAPSVIPPPTADHSEQLGSMAVRPWGFWAAMGLASAIAISALIAQIVIAVVWTLAASASRHDLSPKDAASNGLLLAMATCASAPVVLGLAYLFARIRTGPRAPSYLGFRPVPPKTVLRWSIALLLLIALSDALTVWLSRPIVPPFMVEAYRTAGFVPLFWLALIVAAPLAEETLFRGFLFEGIVRSRLGAIGAVILSSLTWALIHMQYELYGIATIFVSGLLLGYVRLKTGSLYATMFLHALMNLVATVEVVVVLRLES